MLEYWEEFPLRPARRGEKGVRVSLNRQRELRLNKHAMKLLGDPEAVVLLYDPRNHRIGLKPSTLETPNAFPVTYVSILGRRHSARIYASLFCKYNKIRNHENLIFLDPKQYDEILVLDLEGSVEG